jgi:hypothetical protein
MIEKQLFTFHRCHVQVRDNLRGPHAALVEAAEVVFGFHSIFKLNDAEVRALWPLILIRAIVLVVNVEHVVRVCFHTSFFLHSLIANIR